MSRSFASILPLAGVALCLSCAGELPAGDDQPPAGAVRGQLVTSMFDFGDHSELRHSLRLPSGQERELRFEGNPELTPGSTIDVWGSDDGASIRVWRAAAAPTLDDEVSRVRSALITGTKKPTKKWAFVLVDTAGAGNLSKANAELKLFSDMASSIKSYYKEVSYGLQELDGDVIGPLKFDATDAPGGLCNGFPAVGNALRPMIQGTYDQYLFYFLSSIRGCPWGGVAILGTAAKPSRDSYYNAAAECVVLVQEPGHNFGMVHSSALRCTKDGVAVSMIDPVGSGGSCQHDEYGNPFDPMGGGNPGAQTLNSCFHMNGVQKAYQEWLEGCNIVKAGTTGTYTLYPLESACNGTQLLQIPIEQRRLTFPPSPVATLTSATLNGYYLELRTPVGLDKGLARPRVFVVAAGNLKEARLRGNANWLIDMNPGTRSVNDAELGVGKSFQDPAPNGPKFTVLSADETKAVISVQLNGEEASMTPGNGTCADDSVFTGPGASNCQAPPASGGGGAPGTGGAGGTGGGGAGGAGGSGGSAPGGSGGVGGGLPPIFRDAGAVDSKPTLNPADAEPVASADADSEPPLATSVRGGCNCHVGSAGSSGGAIPLVLALLAVFRRRRR
jgi:MYXO-CTERM domain-containing protein